MVVRFIELRQLQNPTELNPAVVKKLYNAAQWFIVLTIWYRNLKFANKIHRLEGTAEL
jgi:hypothetical protein